MSIFQGVARKILSDDIKKLEESNSQSEESLEIFQERLAELELALEDQGWMRLGIDTEREFSREGLKKINQLARIYWLKNPLIKRAVVTQAQYVFGQGVSIQANHAMVNEVVQEFLEDKKNQTELTSHQARMIKETELQCFSNIFFVFFVNKITGRVRVRTINLDEIDDIICNPEDAKDPWYYKRIWTQKVFDFATGSYKDESKTVYYPDWRYNPQGGHPSTIGGHPVEKDTPIYHVKVNALSDMKFGVSEIYNALDWARAYKEFLENWATIVKAYSRFAWQLATKGGKKGVVSAKEKLQSSLGGGLGPDRNPPPLTASTFIGNDGAKLEPIKTAGATTTAEDGRRLLLMVSAATGIYEHYFGDPSTGNLATSKSMERPMELMFRDRQQLWADIKYDILQFVIDQAVKAPRGKIQGTVIYDIITREETVILDNDSENEDETKRDKPIDRHVDVTFPDILEKDMDAKIKAIVSGATLDGKSPAGTLNIKDVTRMILVALGEDDVNEILDKMFPPDEDEPEWPSMGENNEDNPPNPDKLMAEALRDLREAVSSIVKEE